MDKRPIGVFDSGIGGVNVLKSLIEEFPHEDFIYVADTLNVPYGTKSANEIKNLVDRITKYLMSNNAKAIVIACNTATTQAEHLFNLDNLVVLGVIKPTAEDALKNSKNICVLATNATIKAGVYQNIFLKEGKNVFPIMGSELVDAIEAGEIDNELSHTLVYNHLKDLVNEKIDTIVLGCTHFALYEREVKSVLKDARVVNSGKPTSKELRKVLSRKNLLNKSKEKGRVDLKTTLDKEKFEKQIAIFDLKYNSVEKINI